MKSIFARDEYQDGAGNLPHIHLMAEMDLSQLDDEGMSKLENLARANICDIVKQEEVQDFIDDGILKEQNDALEVQQLARQILPHRCNKRYQRRVGAGEGKGNYVCWKLNNCLISPDPTQNVWLDLPKDRHPHVEKILIRIGMAQPRVVNEHTGSETRFISEFSYFNPKQHIPNTNRSDDLNISPVESKTFAACQSMQNIQLIHNTNGLNTYCCKYVAKKDENNRVVFKANAHNPNEIDTKVSFLHNTKITSSKINEDKALEKSHSKNLPRGRAVSVMEMLQNMLGEPEVMTTLVSETISTLPLEQRRGTEKFNRNSYHRYSTDDGVIIGNESQHVRKDLKDLPEWRQHRDPELITIDDSIGSKFNPDKVTLFSVRPPELRVIKLIGMYYRWFCNEKHIER